MLNQAQEQAEDTPGGSEEPISFVEQMRRVKDQKVVFKVEEDDDHHA